MIGFTNEVFVVTGAAQGIGAATAQSLLEAGARVVIADIREEAAREASERAGTGASGVAVDVAESDSVRALIATVHDRFGRLDGWVNNAAVAENSLALDLDDETWRRTIAVDLTGTFFGAREAARYMVGQGTPGSIVNMSSIAAFRATRPEHHVAYDVSKAAVAHMATILAAEWAPHRIRVNAVAPGYTNTELLKVVGVESPETLAAWIGQVPQGRLLDPIEIGRAVTFLLSGAASAVTGQTLHVNGGYTAW